MIHRKRAARAFLSSQRRFTMAAGLFSAVVALGLSSCQNPFSSSQPVSTPTPTVSTYSIDYSGNGNTGGTAPVDSTTYTSGENVTVLGNTGSLTKSGDYFSGWNSSADGTGISYAPGATFTIGSANMTLYAHWTLQPAYTVTYDGNGNTDGTVPADPGTYTNGQTVTVQGNTGNLTKSGYVFEDWNTKADGTGTSYAPAATFTMGSVDMTLYAQWTAKSWQLVGSGALGTGQDGDASMAFDATGTPYVAYIDETNSYQVVVMKFNGTSWVSVGSTGLTSDISTDGSNSIALAVDSSGSPYLAAQDGANSDKATVMEFNGTSWVDVGSAGFSAGQADSLCLAFGPSDTPYVAYEDVANSYRATVMKFNGTSWVNVGSAGFSPSSALYTSLAFDSSGTPYLAYSDASLSLAATVMKFNGTAWVDVGSAGFSAGEADFVSLAFDSSDTPYVAYEDWGNSNKATVMEFNGSSWVDVGSPGFSAGSAEYVSLAIGSTGTPYITYSDIANSLGATVMEFNGTSWEAVGPPDFTAGAAIPIEGAVSPSGVPYVVYGDASNGAATVRAFE